MTEKTIEPKRIDLGDGWTIEMARPDLPELSAYHVEHRGFRVYDMSGDLARATWKRVTELERQNALLREVVALGWRPMDDTSQQYGSALNAARAGGAPEESDG